MEFGLDYIVKRNILQNFKLKISLQLNYYKV